MTASMQIRTRYDELVAHAPVLRQLVRDQLLPFCERGHFGFQDRIKTLDSVAEKLETGRVKSWDELDDLYAATVVVPSLRDESGVVSGLRQLFQEVRLRERALTRTPPDVFRFDFPRFVGKLHYSPEREKSPISDMLFEVQVRTAFEHAWSTATHALTYKSNHNDWKRLRLTAALRATVEQIDLAIVGFERTAQDVLPAIWEESATKLEMLTHYQALFDGGFLPTEIRPAAWNRFIDNVYDLCEAEALRRQGGRARHSEIKNVIDQAIASIDHWARRTPLAQIPRSLSLFQSSFGVLCEARIVSRGIEFVMFGAADVAAVFPGAKGIASQEF